MTLRLASYESADAVLEQSKPKLELALRPIPKKRSEPAAAPASGKSHRRGVQSSRPARERPRAVEKPRTAPPARRGGDEDLLVPGAAKRGSKLANDDEILTPGALNRR